MTDWLVIQQDDHSIVRVQGLKKGLYALQTFTAYDGKNPSAMVLLTDDAIDQLADYVELCRAEEAEAREAAT